jgi:hypothetical protein
MRITRRCKIKFSISANYVDEVECEVAPLDACGVMLGSPYLWDRDATFYRRECDPNWILENICKCCKYTCFLYFILFCLLAQWEGETNNCDCWPSKSIPLKVMRETMKKEEGREMQGERGKDNNRNGSSKRVSCSKLSGRRS